MTLFPERRLSAIYVREKGTREKSGGNIEREKEEETRHWRTNLRRGYDGPLMRLPPCTVAWQPHSRRSEPTPRHVSISRPRIAPRRRNVTRKRADPRSTRHAFWLEAGCFAGTRNPLIGRRPANAFPCRWFFPLFFSMARKLLVESIPVGRIVVGLGKSAGKYCYCKFVSTIFFFVKK